MNVPSLTSPALLALLQDGTLAGEWALDPHESSIRLTNRYLWGLAAVKGVFREVGGGGTIHQDGAATGTFTVAAASIETGNGRRDTHVRSAAFFDVGRYPEIAFTAERVLVSGQGVAVSGALTVRGRTRPLSFDAVASAPGLPGDGEIWLDAVVRVNRADFGLNRYGMGVIGLNSTITIHAVFTRR